MKRIRKLNKNDASKMLLCLKDKDNLKFLLIGYFRYHLNDCVSFIENSKADHSNKHFAIVDDNDEWVGTISLKKIDYENKKAEYSIITDKAVRGKGYAEEATKELFDFAFGQLGLHKIYLNVVSENERAIAFYKKCGFYFVGESRDSVILNGHYHNLKWFEIIGD